MRGRFTFNGDILQICVGPTFHEEAIFVGDGVILVFRSKYDRLMEKSDQQDNKQDVVLSARNKQTSVCMWKYNLV